MGKSGNASIKFFKKGTKDEERFYDLMMEYEAEYFGDMTLKEFEEKLTGVVHKDGQGEAGGLCHDLDLDLGEWVVRLEDLTDCVGRCDSENRAIYIQKSQSPAQRRLILLHEMIHAYESNWERGNQEKYVPAAFRDYVMLRLYKKLKRKVLFKLDYMLELEAHRDFSPKNAHTLLFALKSWDLDSRLKKKFGTVGGYGRADWHNQAGNLLGLRSVQALLKTLRPAFRSFLK